MKFSTRSRYGLRLMLELGLSEKDQLLQIKDIAKNQELPEKYLEQIIIHLKNGNLVKSVRGARGGYLLARSSKEITLKEIIETLEGSLYPVKCAADPSFCPKSTTCPTKDIWKKVGVEIAKVLSSVTLQDLINDSREKAQSAMF